MNIRHVPGPAVAVLALCLLSACSGPDSAITLNFEVDGDTRTVVMHPSSVECRAKNVVGSSVNDQPIGTFVFSLGDDGFLGSGRVTLSQDDEVVTFRASEVPVTVTDGRVELPKTSGEVMIGDLIGPGEEASGHQQVTGSLSADLTCTTD
ncbi:hypothetical protein ACFWHR_08040 [Leucobacter sp. NPDC058333]|uniref:hypothetical protein n=1 Tax=Leucobacter sp. NPDC058333 TaxID=3346450 RepID=UPI0036564D57